MDIFILGFVWGSMAANLFFLLNDKYVSPAQIIVGFIPLTYLYLKSLFSVIPVA